MEKQLRRLAGLQEQLYIDGMSLICPDPRFILVKCKSLLIIQLYNFLQFFSGKGMPSSGGFCHQLLHIRPTILIEKQANGHRFMPQNQAQEFADFVSIFLFHLI